MSSLAFTGHRPKDLPAFMQDWRMRGDFVYQTTSRLMDALDKRGKGVDTIHTGGALGIDTAVALAFGATMLKCHLHLPFVPSVMASKWRTRDREMLYEFWNGDLGYHIICKTCPADHYDVARYDIRNHHMVDSADMLVAYWTGKRHGGTWNAIEYALKQGKPVVNLLNNKIERIR